MEDNHMTSWNKHIFYFFLSRNSTYWIVAELGKQTQVLIPWSQKQVYKSFFRVSFILQFCTLNFRLNASKKSIVLWVKLWPQYLEGCRAPERLLNSKWWRTEYRILLEILACKTFKLNHNLICFNNIFVLKDI